MRLDISNILFFVILFIIRPSFADDPLLIECSIAFEKSAMLNIESYSKLDGLEKAVFSANTSSSPYVTVFDTRKVVVLKTDKMMILSRLLVLPNQKIQ